MNNCIALIQKEDKQKKLINYITTGLQFISENVAVIGKYYEADGRYLAMSFEDMINPKEEQSADEIIDDVMELCGLD